MRRSRVADTLVNGKEYDVVAKRKGSFRGRLLHHCETWATLEIVRGKTEPTMSSGRVDGVGAEVSVRIAWTTFTEAPRG